jgi:signal transduction histidine kinase
VTRFRLLPPEGAPPVKLTEGKPVVIGRSQDCTVVVADKLVSSRHAIVEVGPKGPVIRDLESKNGTWVNGQQLLKPRLLEAGDEIAVGRKILRIAAEPPEAKVEFMEEEGDEQQIFASLDGTDLKLEEANRILAILHGMGELLLDVDDEDDLCSVLIDLVFDVLPADRACVILLDPDGSLVNRAARARTLAREKMDVSRTIVTKVIEEKVSLFTSDAATDERFTAGESIIMQGIRAAMCAPIRGRQDVLGALYADTQVQTGAFAREDLELLTTLGVQGGIAVDNLRLTKENLEAERLAAIGGVVAGLSHDIRNVLGALKTGSFLMNQFVEESESGDVKEAWEIFRHGTDTIGVMVEDMVSYSKERKLEVVPTSLNQLVELVTARLAARAREEGVVLSTELSPEAEEVPLDAPSIDRALTNLLTNALDALGDGGGNVTARTEVQGDEVCLEVRDDGCGIPAENVDHIFDLLFSTKGSKGTGFGLAVTKKIAEEHGGRVECESELGVGTSFRLRLPRG